MRWLIALTLLSLAACNRDDQSNASVDEPQPTTVPAPGTGPDAKTPLAPVNSILPQPKRPIDPKSTEAAGQVVNQYGALIEHGRWTASRQLWTDPEAAKTFEKNFRNDAVVHISIGEPGDQGAAAGSIYVTEAVTFYGKTNDGGDYRRPANITLRRVNDVPGSTEGQRHWHIERIDWEPAA